VSCFCFCARAAAAAKPRSFCTSAPPHSSPSPPPDVVGFSPSQKDVELFTALGNAPDAAKYPNVARFYSHIASFSAAAKAAFPAGFGSAAAAPAKPAAAKPAAPVAEEEDVDLFGEDGGDAAAKVSAAAAASKVRRGSGQRRNARAAVAAWWRERVRRYNPRAARTHADSAPSPPTTARGCPQEEGEGA